MQLHVITLTNFRIHLSQVVHDTVKVELSCTKYHMLARFLNLLNEWVGE